MIRRILATAFVLALFLLAPISVVDQAVVAHAAAAGLAPPNASPLFPAISVDRSCSAHVCNICAQQGLACDPIPFCHCD